MAPEVVRGDLYGFAADIWSVGIVLLELVNGNAPYVSLSPQNECDAMDDSCLGFFYDC